MAQPRPTTGSDSTGAVTLRLSETSTSGPEKYHQVPCNSCLRPRCYCSCQLSNPTAQKHLRSSSDDPLLKRISDYYERNKMLASITYRHNAECLIEDRRKCSAAVTKFNKASGNSNIYLRGIFEREISVPPIMTLPPELANEHRLVCPKGSIGDRVAIESPFVCVYGYNLHIGSDVCIHRGCKISDANTVEIHNGAIISENVTIISGTPCVDPHERQQGKSLAKKVVIGAGAWISANSTILPGVTIGRCSTVSPGSIVTWDVPDYQKR